MGVVVPVSHVLVSLSLSDRRWVTGVKGDQNIGPIRNLFGPDGLYLRRLGLGVKTVVSGRCLNRLCREGDHGSDD